MPSILRIKMKARSVFFKLLLSFLGVIVLLVIFELLTYGVFRQSLRDEIIKYNTVNLTNTTNDYEKHYELLEKTMLNLYLNPRLQELNSKPYLDYVAANKVTDYLSNIVSNQALYLNNLFIYDVKHSLMLEKSRGASPESMFTEYYVNPVYTYSFWKKQFEEGGPMTIYPAASYLRNDSPGDTTGPVWPMLVKSRFYPDFMMLAFVDADRMFQAFHRSVNDNFYVLDASGRLLFASGSAADKPLPALPPGQDWVKADNQYFFYTTGPKTGFTYVNLVPDGHISSQLIKLNLTFVAVLLVAIAASVTVSVLFTVRFNNPVQRIVDSIKSLNEQDTVPRHDNEFELIRGNIGFLLQQRHLRHQDLEEKHALLRYHSYMNKLKKIRGLPVAGAEQLSEQKPFRVVLFHLSFNHPFHTEIQAEEERAASYIREYINHVVTKELEGSLTFQIERNQILSIIHPAPEEEDRLRTTLDGIVSVLSTDKAYCFLTIAVSPLHAHTASLTDAYEEALGLIRHRPFDDETVVLEAQNVPQEPFVVPDALMQEIKANLQAGNAANVLQALRRLMAQMEKRKADALAFHEFAREITHKTTRLLHGIGLDSGKLTDLEPEQLHTVSKLDRYFEAMIGEACRRINNKKEAADPIITGATAYVTERYTEDITLDLVASWLNITGGYLSTYFKEKTGINFLDFVNDVRIGKAKELLRQTDLRIQDIAGRVGYQNMNSFNRMFKKITGVTPSEYRRSGTQM
ncbi:Two-component response regulator, YesN/AraC family, consists of REC and AraC-type DNA-binding domains [Paenibacillus tianmuensis]|uniref:Two-component response regulator, YesN/AraC family, consists of REC and AraC-type DNA-binding domains n=2 Tax=Paenibacillus tianmuensis TaxID=624147 RepID=A0A1G4PDF2_9BACL|nr:Two-component response regulator, YesN/AraC family, consists of REC and AraC-type DNA-binding domains [Paenibacillus tianmuensis]